MWNSVVFVLAVIAVSTAQPPECMNPPAVNPESCCPNAPQFVNKQMMDECTAGGQFNCETSNCILRKGNLLTADGKVDRAAVSGYAVPAEWSAVTNAAIQTCFAEMNGASCESIKFIGCMAHNLMNNCPANVWNNSPECAAVKTFLNACRPPSM